MSTTYVEKCLWDYKKNESKLKTLKAISKDLMSVGGQSYASNSKNGVSDPVSSVVVRLMSIEKKLQNTVARVKPVRQLHADLRKCTDERSVLLWILRLKYFEHWCTDDMKRELAVSGSTLYRMTSELLKIAGTYFAGG